MPAANIRAQNDIQLYDRLLSHPEVIKVRERIARAQEQGPMGTRRHLLATSVRLSSGMAPGIHKMADECGEMLGLEMPLELYVYSSPQYNAACFKPEDGRLFIMFSSSLLEAFSDSELLFVVGHELGHHVYNHHDIPIGHLLKGREKPSASLALNLFTWSRYAEISADRAGAYCARDLHSTASALFKLASGLSGSEVVQFNLDEFLRQLDDMQIEEGEPGQGAPAQDWFSTHPFSPLRVRALKLFYESELLVDKGTTTEQLEIAVQGVMSLMEPSYLESRTNTAEVMRRLLFAGAIVIANADQNIGEAEIDILKKFFGDTFSIDGLDLNKITTELPSRIEATLSEASVTQRMQVLRDLCVLARAEGEAGDEETSVLKAIAVGLEVSPCFVDQCMEDSVELD